MTPDDLKSAIKSLGLTDGGFAHLVGITGANADRTVRRWKAGERDIPGPVIVIVGALMESRAVRRFFGVALDGDSTP
ncbi:hypothetical protein GJ654_18945 [Rhodoblastus acidophilus]|uniref:Transcriptional regulator n=1 Tax=Rhodoblastus acidophilus TaxID=1074 RepID=A0A6N8DR22_RHOAC|nr:hypothetical protein [Rhodoblastus acidophilus]MCW2276406.1 DNA-binding transcriptional regulator YiaG [Rhodoblastus acidophilus]MTV33062.1 hypothetical protein [Rhodoblastus acidophilus]